jgi:hypothetical protein
MAHSTTRKRLGQALRTHFDGITREPLPERWVHLIECLDDKERIDREAAAAPQIKPPPSIAN